MKVGKLKQRFSIQINRQCHLQCSLTNSTKAAVFTLMKCTSGGETLIRQNLSVSARRREKWNSQRPEGESILEEW